MDRRRRRMLRVAGGLGIGGLLLASGVVPAARAAASPLFEARTLEEVLQALGAREIVDGGELALSAPEVAEDGRLVPVGLVSRLPRTEQMVLVIDENPYIVAANFVFSEGVVPEVQTRVKMRRSSRIHVIARAGGRYYVAQREVTVVVGGCGA